MFAQYQTRFLYHNCVVIYTIKKTFKFNFSKFINSLFQQPKQDEKHGNMIDYAPTDKYCAFNVKNLTKIII